MKISSCTHSFVVLALSFVTIQSSFALSIDSKAVARLQPRLDGDAAVPGASSSLSTTRKKKKCSFTPPVSTTPSATGGALPVVTSSSANNASTLANRLSYARSYKTKCTKRPSLVSTFTFISGTPVSGVNSDTGSSGAGNGSPGGSADNVSPGTGDDGPGASTNTGSSGSANDSPGGSTDTGSPRAGSSAPEFSVPADSSAASNGTPDSGPHEGSQPPAAANGQSSNVPGSGGVCGPPQTITVTSHTTVTVTQVAQAAASAEIIGGPKALLDKTSAAASGLDIPVPSAASASSSTSRKRTKCAKSHASKTTVADGLSSSNPPNIGFIGSLANSKISESAMNSSPGSNSDSSGAQAPASVRTGPSESALNSSPGSSSSTSGPHISESTASGPSEAASSNSGETNSGAFDTQTSESGSSSPKSPSENGFYGSGTSYNAISPSGSSGPTYSLPALNSTNSTWTVKLKGQFWAGATISTLRRMEAIPERKFYDFDGKTVKDPIKTLGDAGVNAIRVTGTRAQCLGPTKFINNGSTLGNELNFSWNWGCLDVQVKTAQRGVAEGMRVVLTINQGSDIPEGMQSYTYEQMVSEVRKEAKRQLQPYLDAKIVPDVILLEHEGTDGFLFNETATGHNRGQDDGRVPKAQVDKERCGQIPTGKMDSFPQYTGYLKAEVMACNEAITEAGLSTAAVRYGLHSHGQYVQWKESVFHGPNPLSQTELKDTSGNACSNSVIPQDLLAANASELITIMGFSAYADPITPTDINSPSSQHDALNRTMTTITQLLGYAEAYGKYGSGAFAGEFKLQALGVEYGTSYKYEQVPKEQQITTMLLSFLQQIPNVLGMMWYEPWYCHGNWEGGRAGLCHNIDSNGISGQAPTNTLKTWGAAAISPWKK